MREVPHSSPFRSPATVFFLVGGPAVSIRMVDVQSATRQDCVSDEIGHPRISPAMTLSRSELNEPRPLFLSCSCHGSLKS